MRTQLGKKWQRAARRWTNFYRLCEMRFSLAWQSLLDRLPFEESSWPAWKAKPFQPRLEQLEFRWLLSNGFTEYGVASSPIGITAGPSGDNHIWVAENGTDQIAAVSTTGSVTQYTLPNTASRPYDIIAGPDGALWFTETTPGGGGGPPPLAPSNSSSIGRMTTAGVVTKEYTLQSSSSAPHGLTVGPDGNIWAVESGDSVVDKINISAQTLTTYTLAVGSNPEDITAGPDGNLWITEPGTNKIAVMSTAGSLLHDYSVPTSGSQPWGITNLRNTPGYVLSGSGGVHGGDQGIFFTEESGNKIGFVNLNGTISEYLIPTSNSKPQRIKSTPNGVVWFVESNTGKIGAINSDGSITEMSIPTSTGAAADIGLGPDNAIWWTENAANQVGRDAYPFYGVQPLNDTFSHVSVPVGLDSVDLNAGNLQAQIPLNKQAFAGTQNQNTWGNLSSHDALIYNSMWASPQPIVAVTFQTDPNGSVPSSIAAQLTWAGTAQTTVTYLTTGHSAGDNYLLELQAPASGVTVTGAYSWSVTITATLTGGNVTRTMSGTAFAVVNGPSAFDYYGWSLASQGILVAVSKPQNGLLWVHGGGGIEYFPQLTSTTYQTPLNDPSTLVKNTDGSYTYTNNHQLKYNFDATYGHLTSIVDPHGLIATYAYSGSQLSAIDGPDGGVTTFGYDGGGHLTGIMLADGSQYTISSSGGGVITTVTYPGSVRDFSYDSAGHMTLDQLGLVTGLYTSTITYDTTTSIVNGVNNGGGNQYTLKPMNDQGFGSVAVNVNQEAGVVTDGLSRTTTYQMDSQGHASRETRPDGSIVTITLDYTSNAGVITDPLGHTTTYVYDAAGKGNLVNVLNPDGGVWTYQYDSNFNEINQVTDPDGHTTNYTISSTNGDITKITNALNQVTTLNWSNGLLVSVVDARNNTTTYQYYNGNRLLQDVIDPLGNRTTYAYSYNGGPNQTTVGVEDARQNITSYIYDGIGRLLEVNYADGTNTASSYDALSDLITAQNQLGVTVQYSYDLHGWLTTLTEAVGKPVQRTTTYLYNAVGDLLSQTDPIGTTTSYAYDSLDRMTTVIVDYADPAGKNLQLTTTMLYDAVGNILAVKDPRNTVTCYQYDAMNRLGTIVADYSDSNNQNLRYKTTMTYDKTGNELSMTDPRGTTTCYQYDALNRLTTVIADKSDTLGTNQPATTVHSYDANGNLLSVTDPRGTVTCYQYDALNRVTTETADYSDNSGTDLRATTKYTYDQVGNLLSVTDPRQTVTCYQYNAVNELTTIIADNSDTLGTNRPTTIAMGYDAARNLTSQTDATGTLTCYQYDALNRLATVIRASGTGVQQTSGLSYDGNDNVIATIDPSGARTTVTYDSLNRRVRVEDANTNITTTLYDANGNVTTVTDALSHTTSYAYDAVNRLLNSTSAVNGLTTYAYDGNGNMTGVTDPDGNRTTMSYDALNRLVKQTDPLGNIATYVYDVDRNLTSSTNRNSQVVTYQYDPLNRLTTEVWLNSSNHIVNTLTFAYDLNSNVTKASNNAGTYSMTYNALNEMTSESEPFSVVLTMQYDGVADPTQVQDSFGGTTTYSYDPLHRLTSILFNGTSSQTPLRVDLTYTQQNELGTVTRYSDLAGSNNIGATSYTYDTRMRLTNIQDTNGTGSVLESLTYTYDQANRLTSLTLNGSITTYSYDAVNELTTVTTSSGTTTYSYDANGNRTMAGYMTGTGNQLLNDGTWTYTYDKEGNVTQKYNPTTGETWHYTYDNLNELTGVTDVSGTGTTLMQATYVYDALGNRLEKDIWTQSSGTMTVTRYAYQGQQVWAELSSANGLETRYIHGDMVNELFARESSAGAAAWYLTDREGSVTNLLDGSGALQDTVTYDPYGNPTQTNGAFGDQFLYAEGQYDAETGLQYNEARYYNPAPGRWDSQDPLGFAAGDTNLYRYVYNSPTNATDPSGECWFTAIGAGVGALVGGVGGAASYLITNAITGNGFNAADLGGAVAGGAVSGAVNGAILGAVADLTTGNPLGAVALGAIGVGAGGVSGFLGGVTQSAVSQLGNQGNVNWSEAATQGAYGAAVGAVVGGVTTSIGARISIASEAEARAAARAGWGALPQVEKDIIDKVLKGQLPRSAFDALPEATKRAALARFAAVARNPGGSMGPAATALNKARIDFLAGNSNTPPGGISRFQ